MNENRLIHESSPYLLQHAKNPVDWYPWNEESLNKAKRENKPIFLSIGYSSCHWCHVMAHESFENEEIAKIMNENFINIKVDREERPDIDDIYQKVCQVATGQGGWPLSVFLTPDQKPFYVGTYFPVLDSYGRPGFGSILRQLAQAWKENPNDIKKTAEKFLTALQKTENIQLDSRLDKEVLDEAAINLLTLADMTYGGFGNAPKFPNAANISFMLRYSKLSKIRKFQEFALKTLRRMARGGIFDQIGGGFHRYSTDARWLVPHFEKMLYDNALIAVNYVEAFQITKDPFYLEILQKTLDFVLREMTSPEGGFYSAQDADSEGEEGRYYVWSKKEIQDILGDDADLFCLFYDVTEGGNWEGKNILCNNLELSTVAFKFSKPEDEVKSILKQAAKKLLKHRDGRTHPGLDTKILTSWNALMISAFVKGYRVTDDQKYLDAAKKCCKFLLDRLTKNDVLYRTYSGDNAKIQGFLDDYAYLANSILDLFEVTPSKRYLEQSKRLAEYLLEHFWDSKTNSFFMTGDEHEDLIVRPKSNYDLSLPSGNSVAAHLLLRLYHYTHDSKFLNTSVKIMESQAQMAAENPFGFGYLLTTLYQYMQKPLEITILNTTNSELIRDIEHRFLPESLCVRISEADQLDDLKDYPFFAGKSFPADKTQVYVCKDFSCSLPLEKLSDLEPYL